MTILRGNLLAGRTVAVRPAAPAAEAGADALAAALLEYGAVLHEPETAAGAAVDALVHDARDGFGSGGAAALLASLEAAWAEIEHVANAGLIASGQGGKIVLIAPHPAAGDCAPAASAALENLARTLSVEWARYGITVSAIVPAASA